MGQSVCRALTADSTATRNIQGVRRAGRSLAEDLSHAWHARADRGRLKALRVFATLPTCCASYPLRGGYTMRHLAAALLSCALFSVVLLAGPASEAQAQGYDVSGQAGAGVC